MGKEAEIFLVIFWRYAIFLLYALGALSLTACKRADDPDTVARPVDTAQYEAFWLWAGVRPQAALETAQTVYILDSEYRAATDKSLHILRPAIPKVPDADIWLVMRVETLDWDEGVYAQLLSRLEQWGARSNLAGLQIDFDAQTTGLDGYAMFLKDLRRRLPQRYRLSITGLLDWSANGDPAGLAALGGAVDEIVLQTYQGRSTIPGYAAYFRNIERLESPFRIGLVQGGEWHAPKGLEQHPHFKGYVIFLLNPD